MNGDQLQRFFINKYTAKGSTLELLKETKLLLEIIKELNEVERFLVFEDEEEKERLGKEFKKIKKKLIKSFRERCIEYREFGKAFEGRNLLEYDSDPDSDDEGA